MRTAEEQLMSNKITVTRDLLEALRKVIYPGWHMSTISNTSARTLKKLGWVDLRVTKVYANGEPRNIMRLRLTDGGLGALSAAAATK